MLKALLNFARQRNDRIGSAAALALFPTGILALWATIAIANQPAPPIALAGSAFLLNSMLAGILYISAKR